MSDYLWDKTGEPDAEVERLEELLGEMRYRPREFELPPEMKATRAMIITAPRVVSFKTRRAYAAVAAALLLALFAGAWFITQRHGDAANEARINHAAPQTPAAPASSTGKDSRTPQLAREQEQIVERPQQIIESPQPTERRMRLAKAARRGALKAHDELVAANAARGSNDARMTHAVFSVEEQQQAKEQLMYALRLTSSTLSEVRRKVQETNEKPASEERHKTR